VTLKKEIGKEIAQYTDQLRQHHLPFNLSEKIKLFSTLHQKYTALNNTSNPLPESIKEEIRTFISETIFQTHTTQTHSITSKKELEEFLDQYIKNIKSINYELFNNFIKNNNITKNSQFTESQEMELSSYIDNISDEIGTILSHTDIDQIIENIYNVGIKKFIENFLLNKTSPALFKKIISEEIEIETNENNSRFNPIIILNNCPSDALSSVKNIINFHKDKEQALIEFMKIFSSKTKQYFYENNKNGKINEKKFHVHIDAILSQHPYIEQKSPRTFHYLKKCPVQAAKHGLYIPKEDFGLDHTLVICAQTFEAYALTNTLSMKDVMKSKEKYAALGLPEIKDLNQKLKYIIGKGGFGKVRFARNITTGNYVAVKKFNDPNVAKKEIDSYLAVGEGKNLVRLYNYAIVINKKSQKKAYLFIEFIQGKDGLHYANEIKKDTNINAQHYTKDVAALKHIAREYLFSAVELHKKGVFHCDIKPENFLHATNDDIKIIDYGLYTTDIHKNNGGTRLFACPEVFPSLGKTHLYNAQKHDSFSLGVCLMEQTRAFEKRETRKELIDSLGNRYSVDIEPVQVKNKASFHLAGFENTSHLAGQNIDEVIMKLMDKDPSARITPEEALQLPYFS